MSEAEQLTPIQHLHAMLEAIPITEGEQSPEQMRKNMEDVCAQYPVRAEAEFTPVNAAGVASEWATTPNARRDHAILYFHGGGYVLGSPNTHRTLTGECAHLMKARLLVPDYRMGPEHPFPAAVEDGVAVWRWMLEKEGINPANAAIAGDSAGGGLTAAVLLSLRDQGLPLPACATMLSPWVDLTGESKTLISNAPSDPMVKKDGLLKIAALYLGGAAAKEPYASPLFANLEGLPPLLIQATSAEALYDDARLFAENAKNAGVDATLQNWDGLVHVFQLFHFMLPEGVDALQKMSAFTQKHWRDAGDR